jgi:two-component system nitrate/nitrite response regulator NarL
MVHTPVGQIRLVVVAQLRLYREGLAELLGAREGIRVVGAFPDGASATAEIECLQPEVALVDMAMIDNIEAIRALVERAPGVKIVALGLPETADSVLRCAEAGIAAYVSRNSSVDDTVAAVRKIMQGEAECSPEIVASLIRRVAAMAHDRPEPGAAAKLTRRERQIATLIVTGLSNKEIAAELRIELSTVKNHVHNLFEKLHVGRRTQIAASLRASPAERRDLEPSALETG